MIFVSEEIAKKLSKGAFPLSINSYCSLKISIQFFILTNHEEPKTTIVPNFRIDLKTSSSSINFQTLKNLDLQFKHYVLKSKNG